MPPVGVDALAVSSDGSLLAVFDGESDEIVLFETATMRVRARHAWRLEDEAEPSLEFRPDGATVVGIARPTQGIGGDEEPFTESTVVLVWDVSTGADAETFGRGDGVGRVGNRLVVIGVRDGELDAIVGDPPRVVPLPPLGSQPLALAAGGTRVVALFENGDVAVRGADEAGPGRRFHDDALVSETWRDERNSTWLIGNVPLLTVDAAGRRLFVVDRERKLRVLALPEGRTECEVTLNQSDLLAYHGTGVHRARVELVDDEHRAVVTRDGRVLAAVDVDACSVVESDTGDRTRVTRSLVCSAGLFRVGCTDLEGRVLASFHLDAWRQTHSPRPADLSYGPLAGFSHDGSTGALVSDGHLVVFGARGGDVTLASGSPPLYWESSCGDRATVVRRGGLVACRPYSPRGAPPVLAECVYGDRCVPLPFVPVPEGDGVAALHTSSSGADAVRLADGGVLDLAGATPRDVLTISARIVVVDDAGSITVRDAADGHVVAGPVAASATRIHGAGPDARWLVAGTRRYGARGDFDTLVLVDMSAGRVQPFGDGSLTQLGETWATGSSRDGLRVLDLTTGGVALVPTSDRRDIPNALVGDEVVALLPARLVRVRHGARGPRIINTPRSSIVAVSALSRDGRLYTGCAPTGAAMLDTATGEMRVSLGGPCEALRGGVFDDASAYLIVGIDGGRRVVDIATGRVLLYARVRGEDGQLHGVLADTRGNGWWDGTRLVASLREQGDPRTARLRALVRAPSPFVVIRH